MRFASKCAVVGRPQKRIDLCCAFAGALFASRAGDSQVQPQATATPRIAELGIALPAVGGRQGPRYLKRYFGAAVLQDIRDNLHATYVRTGWRPDGLAFESQRWRREDRELDAICSAGLHAMIIVPSPRDDKRRRGPHRQRR